MTAASDPNVSELRIRPAVRGLVLTPQREVLLVRFEFDRPVARTVWALPGGGIDPGETALQALCRELREELGHEIAAADIGPHVWNRLHVIAFPDGLWDGQREEVHLVDVPARFEPRPMFTWEQLEEEHVHGMRWWHVDEITAATDVIFVPAELAAVVRRILDDGPPPDPFDVGV